MLYRTPHPFFFQFRTFTSSPISSSATGAVPFSTNPCVQAETEMECVEAALKTSLKSDSGVKSFTPAVFEEVLAGNGQNGAACDDFFVDELLDLSNEDGFVKEEPAEEEEEEEEEEEDKGLGSVSVRREPENSNTDTNAAATNKINNIICSVKDEFGPGLSVPADDVADLEWLSHFVEDSFSEFAVPYPAGMLTEKPKSEETPEPEPEPEPEQEPEKPCFKTPVPAKARSKRTRTGGRVWSLGSPSLTESSSSSSTSTTSSSSPSSPWLIYAVTAQNSDPLEPVRPPAKKQKTKQPGEAGTAQPPRRCSHCGVQKTPQWRTGPLGAKTLCNACGVRFKSGRLLPEYRPACSPTFSSELHSNHHRKVLEMRRKKELLGETESGLAPPVVSSF